MAEPGAQSVPKASCPAAPGRHLPTALPALHRAARVGVWVGGGTHCPLCVPAAPTAHEVLLL